MKIVARITITLCACLGAVLCQTPVIADGGILNAASFDKTPGAPVAPGSLVSIFGTSLTGALALNDTVPLSTQLANVSVTFNGIQAGLDGVFPGSPDQINAQVPWNVLPSGATTGTATVVVTRSGTMSATKLVNIGVAPGIFSFPPGAGYAIAINADGSLAAPSGSIPGIATHPAKVGDVIIVYATGLGAVDSDIANGANSLDKLRNTLARPTVLIGGQSAPVFFSGLTPQFPGVNQLNVQVPAGVPTGDKVALQLQVSGGAPTTSNVVIAVQ
jgi:uncharacterized protein (TIGR03437 family)